MYRYFKNKINISQRYVVLLVSDELQRATKSEKVLRRIEKVFKLLLPGKETIRMIEICPKNWHLQLNRAHSIAHCINLNTFHIIAHS